MAIESWRVSARTLFDGGDLFLQRRRGVDARAERADARFAGIDPPRHAVEGIEDLDGGRLCRLGHAGQLCGCLRYGPAAFLDRDLDPVQEGDDPEERIEHVSH